ASLNEVAGKRSRSFGSICARTANGRTPFSRWNGSFPERIAKRTGPQGFGPPPNRCIARCKEIVLPEGTDPQDFAIKSARKAWAERALTRRQRPRTDRHGSRLFPACRQQHHRREGT